MERLPPKSLDCKLRPVCEAEKNYDGVYTVKVRCSAVCLPQLVKQSYLWLRHPVDTKVICKNCHPRESWIQDDRSFDQILWINMTPDILQRKLIHRDENSLSSVHFAEVFLDQSFSWCEMKWFIFSPTTNCFSRCTSALLRLQWTTN